MDGLIVIFMHDISENQFMILTKAACALEQVPVPIILR